MTTFLNNEAKGTNVIGSTSLQDMVSKLKKPRRVMMLVKAGSAVDAFIDQLVPLLEPGDIIIDGGNSEYQDTQRRCKQLKAKGLLYIGTGVSGGEEGARYGPSLMPGGHSEAWYVWACITAITVPKISFVVHKPWAVYTFLLDS